MTSEGLFSAVAASLENVPEADVAGAREPATSESQSHASRTPVTVRSARLSQDAAGLTALLVAACALNCAQRRRIHRDSGERRGTTGWRKPALDILFRTHRDGAGKRRYVSKTGALTGLRVRIPPPPLPCTTSRYAASRSDSRALSAARLLSDLSFAAGPTRARPLSGRRPPAYPRTAGRTGSSASSARVERARAAVESAGSVYRPGLPWCEGVDDPSWAPGKCEHMSSPREDHPGVARKTNLVISAGHRNEQPFPFAQVESGLLAD
jgi:hypothetical protein